MCDEALFCTPQLIADKMCVVNEYRKEVKVKIRRKRLCVSSNIQEK